MYLNNTNNLIQIEVGEKIKQADRGSTLSFLLADNKRNPANISNSTSASVALYDKENKVIVGQR